MHLKDFSVSENFQLLWYWTGFGFVCLCGTFNFLHVNCNTHLVWYLLSFLRPICDPSCKKNNLHIYHCSFFKEKNGFIALLWPRLCSDRQHLLRWLPADVCWTPWWNTILQINHNNKRGCKKEVAFAEGSVFMETSNFATAVTLSLGVLLHELRYHRQQTPTNFPLPPQWSPSPTPHPPTENPGLSKFVEV